MLKWQETVQTPCCWLHRWLSSIFLVLLFSLVMSLFCEILFIFCTVMLAPYQITWHLTKLMYYSNYVYNQSVLCWTNNNNYNNNHVQRKWFDGAPSRKPVTKLEIKFSWKKKTKKLILTCKNILINILMSSKMYCYFKGRLRSRRNTHSIKFVQKWERNGIFHDQQCIKNHWVVESLSKHVSQYLEAINIERNISKYIEIVFSEISHIMSTRM